MFPLVRASVEPTTTLTAPQEFCAACDVSDRLAAALLLDEAGQPFVPATIALELDPTVLPEQLALLMRSEPVGGAEPLVRANQRRLKEAFEHALSQRLLASGQHVSLDRFLRDLQAELRRLRDMLDQQRREVDERYEQVNALLRGWQEAAHEPQGMWSGLAKWLLGGSNLSLPQAVGVWCEREQLAARRLGSTTATTLLNYWIEALGVLLDNQQAAAKLAQHLAEQSRQRLETLARADGGYSPWTWRGDSATIAAQLSQRADYARLGAQLGVTLTKSDGAEQFAGVATQLAAAEAERLLADLDLAQLIEIEAALDPAEEVDPLILVGQRLIELVDRQPSWRLVRTARPRVETVQITDDGSPLFRLEGLQTAAYGAAVDRLGFLQVELEVAVDDLWLLREGDAEFAEALNQRNFFVLEELCEDGGCLHAL